MCVIRVLKTEELGNKSDVIVGVGRSRVRDLLDTGIRLNLGLCRGWSLWWYWRGNNWIRRWYGRGRLGSSEYRVLGTSTLTIEAIIFVMAISTAPVAVSGGTGSSL